MRQAPLILLVAAVTFAGGCVYVPHAPRHTLGPDVAAAVGSARSSKAIRPGASSQDQVENLLGRPHEAEGDRWRYYWAEDVGTLYSLRNPFNDSHEHPQVRTRVVEFQFDEAGRLRRYRVSGARDYIAYEKITAASRPSQP